MCHMILGKVAAVEPPEHLAPYSLNRFKSMKILELSYIGIDTRLKSLKEVNLRKA